LLCRNKEDYILIFLIVWFSWFYSRAGHKLEAALKEFNVDCVGKVALDLGLSIGGFTDCLLQNGASHVYGVDVGYGQVHFICS
jgi:predicted rRNA methylase YqxC with S4 and FtsJ domains